ncbi:MAG: imidazolonepropionase [Nakamurella sp.]
MTTPPGLDRPQDVDLVITGSAEIFDAAPRSATGTRHGAGSIAIDGGRIVAVGDVSGYHGRESIDAANGVVIPGLVDAHTHVVFGGSRVAEYAAKVAGVPVPDGAPAGIVGTMTLTRAAGVEELVTQAGARIAEMVAHGTTTVESKTGYGLSIEAEQKLLEVNRILDEQMPARIVSTYTGGHAFAPGVDHDEYVRAVAAQARAAGASGLAQFNDVYCDEGYFDLTQTRAILEAGLESGLRPRVHLDAYSHTGAALLTAELSAASADHLNFTTDAELRSLADAGVSGVYLPCLEYAVKHLKPLEPRRVLDAGMTLALATDICPGCWTTSMQMVIVMACRNGGLSVREALTAATFGSAVSLGLSNDIGSIEPGKRADLVVLDVPSHEDIAYRIGRNNARIVIAGGAVVAVRDADDAARELLHP